MILAESCRERGRPLEMHQDALAAGTSFTWLPEPEVRRLYLALGLAALRAEDAEPAIALLQDIRRQNIPVPASVLTLIVKRCTARRLFQKSLSAYDIAVSEKATPSIDDREFWSNLLLSAVEAGKLERCDVFW